MKRAHIHLTARQLAQLQVLSGQSGLSMAELVRRAVDDFLRSPAAAVSYPADTGSLGTTKNDDGANET